MKTELIISSLIFKNKKYSEYFRALNILTNSRQVSSTNRPEYNNILEPFNDIENVVIVSAINFIQSTYIINKTLKNRKLDIIKISGNNCVFLKLSKGGLISEINSSINIKDFLPESFCKKIIYFNLEDENKTYCFSEFEKNKWTLEDPLNIEINNYQKTTSRVILTNIINNI